MRYQFSTWQETRAACTILSEHVKPFEPQYIVTVPRGGWVVAVLLAHNLGLQGESLYSVSRSQNQFSQTIPKLEGRILLVDEICDTGETLSRLYKHVRAVCSGEIRTAVLHLKRGAMYRPDYYVHEIDRDVWISYPWE